MFKHIHPHARLWIATVVILGIFLVLNPRVQIMSHAPKGQVIAYYQNDYQRFAIDELIKRDNVEQYSCLHELWIRESNWRPKAKNKESSAMGIAQLLNSTWKNIGHKPTKDGYKQVLAGLDYLDHRYGKKGVCRAYAHHLAKGWY